MKQFAIRSLPYIFIAILLQGIGWYQLKYFAGEGDLIRIGAHFIPRRYTDTPILPEAQSKQAEQVLIVGDSHLDQSPLKRRFQEYLTTPSSCHSFHSYENGKNPIISAVKLVEHSNYQPETLVIQIIERSLLASALDFVASRDLSDPLRPKVWKQRTNTVPYRIDNGIAASLTFLGITNSWFNNHRCLTLKTTNSPPLYHNHLILLLSKVFNNRKKPEETQSIIRDLTVRLHDILDPKNIEFLLYVIPDKETVYTDFFDSKKLPASFLEYDSLPLEVISPVNELKHAVNKGEMEVFKYSDTHLGESGARIVGQHLQAVLNNL